MPELEINYLLFTVYCIFMETRTCYYFLMKIRTKIISAAIFPCISGQRSYLLLFSHGYRDKIISAAIFPWISGQRSYLLVFFHGYEGKDHTDKDHGIFPWISGQSSCLLIFSIDIRTKIIPVGIFPWIPGRQETPGRRRRQLIPKLELLKKSKRPLKDL